MADLRIVDAPLLSSVKGTEKIPTGGEGNFSVSVNQVADFAKLKWFLATESYVDNAVGNVQADLNLHKNNSSNPHQVSKVQVGLGNVDNTADVDKPIGSATQAALSTLTQTKADKTYVNTKYSSHIKTFLNTGTALSNTVNGEYFFIISSDSEKVEDLYLNVNGVATNQNKSELSSLLQHNSILGRDVTGAHHTTSISTASGVNQQALNDFGGAKWYAKVGGYELGATVKLENGDIVKNTVPNNTNDPNVDMTGWVNETKFAENKDKTFLDFGAKGDGVTDDSISIGLASTWSTIYKRKVTGLDKTYKCSNVFFDSNCYLADAKLINNKDQDLISVLTTAISSDWLENVVFEDIHIDGVRQDARTIKSTVTSEDGGRHGFRFRRPCRNIWIIRSSANYCASDGLCIFPDYSGGLFESVQNFNIIDSEFEWNRRHGGSNDRTNGINFTNVKCRNNGLPLEGGSGFPATDGRNGDTFNGNYYGNGWDSEEYDDTTISQNMTFLNCEMTGNARAGLLILSTAGVNTPSTPANIKIIGGKYDKGVYNTDDNAAITITPNGLSNVNPIYANTVIDGVSTTNNILLRNNVNFSVTNTPCFLAVLDRSNGFADKKIRGVDIAPTASLKTPDGTPFGMFNYDVATGTKTSVDYQITHNMFNDGQSKYQDFRVGAFKFGQIETKVDSATNSTTWTWKTGATDVERFRVGRYGAQLHIADSVPNSEIVNQGLVFELVSNTQLRIKVKGSDGVVRSNTLTLA